MRGDHRPWARGQGETAKAYEAFSIYLGLGPSRSIAKALEAAGRPPGNRRHWERWSSRFDWAERSQAYDSEQLLREMEARAERREKVRQRIYDQAEDIVAELLELFHGRMGLGDVDELLNKHQEKVGERSRVPAGVRRELGIQLLGLIGLIAPKRVEVSGREADEIRLQVRVGLKELDPATIESLAKLLGVET